MSVTAESAPHPSAAPEQQIPQEIYQQYGLQIALVGLDSNKRNFAMEAAHNELETMLARRGVRGFLTRVFKGNLMRGHFLLKHTLRAQRTLEEHNNLLHFHNAPAEAYEQPLFQRFTDPEEDMLYKAAGEERVNLRHIDTSSTSLHAEAMLLIKARVEGTNPRLEKQETFEKDFRDAIKRHSWESNIKQYLGKGRIHSNNLWDVSERVRALVDDMRQAGQEVDIDAILAGIDFYVGKGSVGPHASYNQSLMEKIARRVEGHGRFGAHEASIISATTLACAIGGLTLQRTVGVATALLPGVAAGIWAGWREGRIMDDERVTRHRRAAQGDGIAPRGKNDYETVNAVEMIREFEAFIDPNTGGVHFDSRDEYLRYLKLIVRGESLTHIAGAQRKDVITTSSPAAFDREFFDLHRTVKYAKEYVYRWLAESDPELLKTHFRMGNAEVRHIHEQGRASLDEQLEQVQILRSHIQEELAERDSAYEWEKLRRQTKVGSMVGGLAVLGGVVAQEALAAILPGRQGLFESIKANDKSQTFLATLFNRGNGPAVPPPAATGENITMLGDNILRLPSNFQVEKTGSTLNITGPDNLRLTGLTYNADGTLTEASLKQLQEAGLTVDPQTVTTGSKETVAKQLTPAQFIEQNPNASRAVVTDFYYTNNTAAVDGNEDRLRYGGNHGLDRAGNYVIDVRGMDPYGSIHGNTYLDWREAAKRNNLWVAMTASADTRNRAFLAPIDAKTGQAVIAKDSAPAALFRKGTGNSGPTFLGHRLQVVEGGGRDGNGRLHIRPLATQLGTGKAMFTDTVEVDNTETKTTYVVGYNQVAAAQPVNMTTPPADSMNILPIIPPPLPRGAATPPTPPRNNEAPAEPFLPPQPPAAPPPTPGGRHAAAEAQLREEEAVHNNLGYHAQPDDPRSDPDDTYGVQTVPTPTPPTSSADGEYPSRTPTSIAQAYYDRILATGAPLHEAQERLAALLHGAGLRRKDFSFSDNGSRVTVNRDVRIARHTAIPPTPKKRILPARRRARSAATAAIRLAS